MDLKLLNALATFAIFSVLSFVIAYFLGRKRQIGLSWSLFFCFFMTPIIGFVITMLSRKYYDTNPNISKGKRIVGRTLSVLGFISALGQLISIILLKGQAPPSQYNALFLGIGLAGLGYYLLGLGSGKNYNTSSLTKRI